MGRCWDSWCSVGWGRGLRCGFWVEVMVSGGGGGVGELRGLKKKNLGEVGG